MTRVVRDDVANYRAGMGMYCEQVLPRLIDRLCGNQGMDRWRSKVTTGLSGEIVEIGFGTGRNIPLYPPGVQRVYAVEPSTTAMKMARTRIERSWIGVVHVGLDGQTIALDDESCDGALCTFTLCTVPDPTRALSELRRVLRPGGRFHFLEHGIAPDESVAKWQRRLDPWECRLADGCHLIRDPRQLVGDAGFELEVVKQRYAKGPKPWSYFTVGQAIKN